MQGRRISVSEAGREAQFQPWAIPVALVACIENYRGPLLHGRPSPQPSLDTTELLKGKLKYAAFPQGQAQAGLTPAAGHVQHGVQRFWKPRLTSLLCREHGFITFYFMLDLWNYSSGTRQACSKESMSKRVLIGIYFSAGADLLELITSANLQGTFF